MRLRFMIIGVLLCLTVPIAAQGPLNEVCPPAGIQPRPVEFQPGGIILTTFDRENLWVYDIDRATRYPLPETRPCTSNCRLSPDANWITYLNPENFAYTKMRLDGTQRTPLVGFVMDVEWWSAEALLVWTTAGEAYVMPEDNREQRDYLPVDGVIAVQPGGRWGVRLEPLPDSDDFRRVLVNLETVNNPEVEEQTVALGLDTRYFNALSWSPDGAWLAYVSRGAVDPGTNIAGAELFLIRPGEFVPRQATFLSGTYGAVRINGQAIGELSWSPDSTRIAFWVIELLGSNIEGNTGHAVVHLLDVNSGEITVYCGFSTNDHTPNPPRLVWSPDGTHLAFGANVPGDNRGSLLLALNLADGAVTELSNGIYPALGSPDVIAWGNRP